MQVEVIRPIQIGGGRTLPVGSVLDADGWPPVRLRQFIELRYVVPVQLPTPTERARRTKGADA